MRRKRHKRVVGGTVGEGKAQTEEQEEDVQKRRWRKCTNKRRRRRKKAVMKAEEEKENIERIMVGLKEEILKKENRFRKFYRDCRKSGKIKRCK